MLYTLTFTKRIEGAEGQGMLRVQMMEPNGTPTTIQVEAESRSGAIFHTDTETFCKENGCSVRRVLP